MSKETGGKNIVICCDGTLAKYESRDKNTNVVKLYETLAADGPEQISFYDPGVGTYSPLRNSLWRRLEAGIESISGSGVPGKVAEAYKYLMDHYEEGDTLFLFGYSWGAHTVRDLAGLVYSCGLLASGSDNLIPYAMDFYYRRESKKNTDICVQFRHTFSRQCKVYFIGAWDTVASVGWLWWRRYFRNAVLNPDVTFAFQALAVDERGAHFRPSLWNEVKIPEGQVIEQVWFPGYHGGTGGQNADPWISDIPLFWMLTNAEQRGLKLTGTWQVGLNPEPVNGNTKRSDKWACRLLARSRRVPDDAKIHRRVFDWLEGTDYKPPNLPAHHEVVG